MLKKMLFPVVLIAGLVVVASLTAVAQNNGLSIRSRGEAVQMPAPPPVTTQGVIEPNLPPPYCSPCLFYGGDLDPTNRLANGLLIGKGLIFLDSAVYSAFQVPHGKTWTVRGLFANTLSTVGVIDPPQADWEIRSGVSSGNGGTVVASGTGAATFNPTGRIFIDKEYTVLVRLPAPGITLTGGTYYMAVIPYCTNASNSNCQTAQYFESDVEPPIRNSKGRQPIDDAFFNEPAGGDNFEPTWGNNPETCYIGCDGFSTGLIGKSQ
ncbi:MAG: hypothetical protein LAN83_18090 [Acidobacteriia bacterium]|nr:hypothetical protein [Terriglobia bacterium]